MGPALVPLAVMVGGALISKFMAPKPPKPPEMAPQAIATPPPKAPTLANSGARNAAALSRARSANIKQSTTVTGAGGLLSDDAETTSGTLLS